MEWSEYLHCVEVRFGAQACSFAMDEIVLAHVAPWDRSQTDLEI